MDEKYSIDIEFVSKDNDFTTSEKLRAFPSGIYARYAGSGRAVSPKAKELMVTV